MLARQRRTQPPLHVTGRVDSASHGVYLLHAEFPGFHSAFVFFLLSRSLRQEENLPVLFGSFPFPKTFFESLLMGDNGGVLCAELQE
jgi:hypothetical protein